MASGWRKPTGMPFLRWRLSDIEAVFTMQRRLFSLALRHCGRCLLLLERAAGGFTRILFLSLNISHRVNS
jgi:hypothetical protein